MPAITATRRVVFRLYRIGRTADGTTQRTRKGGDFASIATAEAYALKQGGGRFERESVLIRTDGAQKVMRVVPMHVERLHAQEYTPSERTDDVMARFDTPDLPDLRDGRLE